jgi:two-component system sensor kinase FixL
VLVDRVQIQQVLVNLLRNAVEAMEQSEQRQLTLTATRHGEDRVEVTVADTGHGIAEVVARQLFKPFVTTKDHGMGIGLAISKTIVEAHGGMLTAEPNPGGGTIFRFTMPADASKSP